MSIPRVFGSNIFVVTTLILSLTGPAMAEDQGNNGKLLKDISPGSKITFQGPLTFPVSDGVEFILRRGKVYPASSWQKALAKEPHCVIYTREPVTAAKTLNKGDQIEITDNQLYPKQDGSGLAHTRYLENGHLYIETAKDPFIASMSCLGQRRGGGDAPVYHDDPAKLKVFGFRQNFGWAVTIDEPITKAARIEKRGSKDFNRALAILNAPIKSGQNEAESEEKLNTHGGNGSATYRNLKTNIKASAELAI